MHANKHTYAKRQLVLLVVSLAVLIVVLISVIRHKGGLEPAAGSGRTQTCYRRAFQMLYYRK